MTDIREDVVWAALNRAYTLLDTTIHNSLDKEHEFKKQTVLADKTLTKDEKSEVIKLLNKDYDNYKILYNEGTKRICVNCQDECLATLYCEHCLNGFHAYNNLQNVKYLTKGGCSEIYTAVWVDGSYEEWDSKEKQLTRSGNQKVILKELENLESANQRWFEESKSHLTISSKWPDVVQCYGLTKNPSSGNYMLVMNKMEMDLRIHLKLNHNKLLWKERIQIACNIINGIDNIHNENAIHRDLHSGNILFEYTNNFRISDLGFCGPVDKPLNSVYGNLPYIAPEVITEKNTTFASDIYSIGILMWEISSGQLPFVNYEYLAMKIVNGMRPKIVPGTPLEYKKLMEQCWDADLTKRPDAIILETEMKKLLLSFQNNQVESQNQIISNRHQQLSNYYLSN
ncbi:Ste11p [Rhizophagus irregularis DAOM 197198w]|uniref:Ste11p n=1 Tax=Rhizophagus irregularis (strain DAOM 197198w) TaxID=1432141 RepID=A0A015ITF9_RHIIW|nr:Ste11p [Rhizophagus irregularis DAOM 197198w]